MTRRKSVGSASSRPDRTPSSRAVEAPRPGASILAPRSPYLLPGLVLVATRLLAWRMLPLASEDAYITFRFARNLASGGGLVYNPGARVFGFSSPPWTLWNALGYALLHDPVVWTRLTTLAAELATLLLVTRMIERDDGGAPRAGRAAAWCFALFFAAWPFFSIVAVSGMETSAMLALVAGGAFLSRRRSPASGPVLGLLGLWRPEGLVAAAVLSLGARARDRLIALLIVAAGLVALTAYFGSPLPQSLVAKASLYGTPGPWAGRHWWDWAVPMLTGSAPHTGEGRLLFPLAVLMAPAALAGALALWPRRDTPLALTAAACLAVWLGYAVLGVAYFYWYLVLPLAGLAMLAAVGLPRILRGPWVLAACALYVLTSWTSAYPLYVGRAQNEFYGFATVADRLRSLARPGDKVLLEPIGMVGYLDPLVVVDEVGLVSPAVARRRLLGPGWYADVAAGERPDWIVLRRGQFEGGQAFAGRGAPFRTPAERDSLFARYLTVAVVDAETSGANALVILHRR